MLSDYRPQRICDYVHRWESLSRELGLCWRGGLSSGALCPGGSLPRGGLCQGVCAQGRVSVQGVSVHRGLCQGVLGLEVSVRETLCMEMSGQYASHWNAFLSQME